MLLATVAIDTTTAISKSVPFSVSVATKCLSAQMLTAGARRKLWIPMRLSRVFRFLDVGTIVSVDVIKWVAMGISNSHSFSVFPPRMPKSTFPSAVQEKISKMAPKNVKPSEIKM